MPLHSKKLLLYFIFDTVETLSKVKWNGRCGENAMTEENIHSGLLKVQALSKKRPRLLSLD